MKKNYRIGISLIEIVIVFAVIAILTGIIANGFLGFRETRAISGDTESVGTIIHDAWSRTLSSKNAMQYGVHFEVGKVVLFEGTTYSSSDPNNEEHILNSLVEIGTISLNGGGSEVIFKRLDGTTDEYGSIILRIINDVTETRTITIEATGSIKES